MINLRLCVNQTQAESHIERHSHGNPEVIEFIPQYVQTASRSSFRIRIICPYKKIEFPVVGLR
jgi:hypothetical protein